MNKVSSASLVLSVALLAGCATSGPLGKADKKFQRGEYQAAIPLYQTAIKSNKEVGQANFKIAESYRLSNRIKEAQPYYEAALGKGVKSEEAYFYNALGLRAAGRTDDAIAALNDYQEKGGRKFADQSAQLSAALNASKMMKAMAPKYEVRNLEQVNTASAEYGGGMRQGELYFASGRDGKVYPGNGEFFTDLYTVKFDDPATMMGGAPARLANDAINTASMHEASATFSPDGNTMIFARSNDGSKKGALSVDLYQSRYENGAWSTPSILPLSVPNADDFAPAISPDGQTLYFASSRRGGSGGNDIYKAESAGTGRWGTPEAVAEVNTAGNENFPSVGPDGTLYFSSDTHPGMGGLDIFRLKGGKVENLGPAVNSTADDFAPTFTGPDRGVFTSNREGGKGSDDLYSFRRLPRKTVTFYADGTVTERPEKGEQTVRPVANQPVTVMSNGRQVGQSVTDANGHFSIKVDSAQTLRATAERDGYFTAVQEFTVPNPPAQDQLAQPTNDIKVPVSLTLVKIVKDVAIVLENIFYDYNKADIRPDAAVELDKLVTIMNDNPKISIELSSHTDSRGKDAYNLKLSADRAKSAVAYIVSKGVAQSRMTSRGYGETRPIIKNAKTEEEYQRNRRTEFKVTKIATGDAMNPAMPEPMPPKAPTKKAPAKKPAPRKK